MISDKGIFCYVNVGTLGKPLGNLRMLEELVAKRTNLVTGGLKLSVLLPSPNLQGAEGLENEFSWLTIGHSFMMRSRKIMLL